MDCAHPRDPRFAANRHANFRGRFRTGTCMMCNTVVHRGSLIAEPLEKRTLLAVDLLADFNTAPNGSDADLFVHLGQRVIFSAQTANRFGGLWSTDGTPQGTHLIPQVTRLGAEFTSAV